MTNKNQKGMERKSEWKSVFIISFIIFLFIFTYAIIRYNVFKGVAIEHIPLFISNKAIAVTAVVLIGLSYIMGPLARFWPTVFVPKLKFRKYFGLGGFGLAAIHSIISLLLFSPSYYPKFFSDGKLNLTGELSIVFGIIALFIFSIVAITSLPSFEQSMDRKKWLFIQRLGYVAFFLVLLHVFTMGFEGWLKPANFPGGLLPMSLIAFIIIALVLLMRLIVIIFPKKEG